VLATRLGYALIRDLIADIGALKVNLSQEQTKRSLDLSWALVFIGAVMRCIYLLFGGIDNAYDLREPRKIPVYLESTD
jgi:hypothetical protein